jgi:predicted pyridoxine 5'-phosphate oxidase superfamily flavin-nucleotide-binding protein
MGHRFSEIMFGDAVRAAQERYGSRGQNERLLALGHANERLTGPEAAFIEARDGFYLASVGESGWPYIQFRGGAPGFVRVLDDKTLGYADFRGNRQYISTGNIGADGRVALFFMDYAGRARLKLLGRARVVDAGASPELVRALEVPGYRARVERAVLIAVEAFEWNCSQHITPRYTEPEIEGRERALLARIAELEGRLQGGQSGAGQGSGAPAPAMGQASRGGQD